jgi:hypothetical protein
LGELASSGASVPKLIFFGETFSSLIFALLKLPVGM